MAENCPFSGQPCPHKKVTHVTELKKDGRVVELHMCQICTGRYMMMDPDTMKEPPAAIPPPEPVVEKKFNPPPSSVGAALGQLLGALIAHKKPQVRRQEKPQKPPCPACGMALADIARSGRLGCGECYVHFAEEMKTVSSHIHKADRHVGKVPASWSEDEKKRKEKEELALSIEEQIKSLKIKMARAVELENYEVAGVLRDKLKELQRQLPTDDS